MRYEEHELLYRWDVWQTCSEDAVVKGTGRGSSENGGCSRSTHHSRDATALGLPSCDEPQRGSEQN